MTDLTPADRISRVVGSTQDESYLVRPATRPPLLEAPGRSDGAAEDGGNG